MKVILFGSTGMIGQGVLRECLDDPRIESVLTVNRKSSGLSHNKLKELIHEDFYDLSAIEKDFKDYDSCYYCIGITSAGLSEADYYKNTFELTTSVAKTVLSANKNMIFCYISGAGSDSSEKTKSMWARVKGKTENTLLAMPFKAVFMFRPGYIQPIDGIKSRTALYNTMYSISKPLYIILKHFEGIVTNTRTLGKAMINVSIEGAEKRILESKDINKTGNESPA